MSPSGDTRKLHNGLSKSGWGTYISGFQVDTWNLDYQFLKKAFSPDPTYAYFDSATRSTWIPEKYYDFIIDLVLQSSVGYYFDSEMDGWVTSC